MHIADFSVGMLGANGVVAAGIPIAVGAAHSLAIQGRSGVVCCFFGDGAVNRGPFLEGLNWAAAFALPVLFVCEDNRWSATTRTGSLTAGAGAAARALACNVPSEIVDGNDVEAVDATSAQLLAEIRAGRGPRLLHAVTYRFKGHVSVDPAAYRDPEELASAQRTDPLRVARERLLALGTAEAALEAAERAARATIEEAVASAHAAAAPAAAAAYTDVQDLGAGRWY
jgi:pyruvate dehydrogenase E1 component alpha subunit